VSTAHDRVRSDLDRRHMRQPPIAAEGRTRPGAPVAEEAGRGADDLRRGAGLSKILRRPPTRAPVPCSI